MKTRREQDTIRRGERGTDPVGSDADSHLRQKSRFSSPDHPERSEKTLPGDRGMNEHESESQGSE